MVVYGCFTVCIFLALGCLSACNAICPMVAYACFIVCITLCSMVLLHKLLCSMSICSCYGQICFVFQFHLDLQSMKSLIHEKLEKVP